MQESVEVLRRDKTRPSRVKPLAQEAIDEVVRLTATRAAARGDYAAHRHPKVIAWLGRHPRFVFHFTSTCSGANAVETFFAALTKRRLKRGVFRSVYDLQCAINRYADPNKIIAARQRGLDV